ncbi:hypothetical protein RAS1_12760 [Phycisphaerae bacterium RAS1]|nr:hypothetical protein RAS1_12760 [Phycisphaerae bacterium RAS1]
MGEQDTIHRPAFSPERIARPPLDDALTERVIGAAIEVHRHLGPGLLESAYEECLCWELKERGIALARQAPLPVIYKGVRLDVGYRIDVFVEEALIVEVKAVEVLMPVHDAQLLTYMKLKGVKKGLLLNFHVALLRDGIRRRLL